MFWYLVSSVQSGVKNATSFMRRNRRRILAALIIGGSTYFIIRIWRSRLEQTQRELKSAEKTISSLSKMRLQSYFESAQRGSDSTVFSFIPQIKQRLQTVLQVASSSELRSTMKASNEEKIQAWEQMKNQAFIRTISGVYCIVLIVLFLRVEVNILGRYLFLDNASPPNQDDEEQPITQETQKKYLDFSEYMRGEGLKELAEYISKKVEEELVNWPLAKMYTFEDLMVMIGKIRMRVEGAPRDTEESIPRMNVFYQFLLPAEDSQVKDKQLVCLLNETRDVLESNHFEHVLQVCLAKGFGILCDHLRDAFTGALSSSQNANKVSDSLPMPKIIPLVKKEFDAITETTSKSPSEPSFTQVISSMKDLEEYSYYIFTSSYDEV